MNGSSYCMYKSCVHVLASQQWHEWSIAVAIVAQSQSTGGHNQLSWVLFPAIASFLFSLFMMFVMITCGLIITHIIHALSF